MPSNSSIAQIGWKAKNFSLPSISGTVVSYNEIKRKNGTLIAFICNHCPYVVDILPRMISDFKKLEALEVGVVAIMSNDSKQYPEDSFENMKIFANKNKFFFNYLYDESQDVAASYKAVCTPDFFCFDKNDSLFYRGRLDNIKYKQKIQETRISELLNAFNRQIQNNEIMDRQISSMGCSIKWKRT